METYIRILACNNNLHSWICSQVTVFLREGGSPDNLLAMIFDNASNEKPLRPSINILIWAIQIDMDHLTVLQQMLSTMDASHFYFRALEPNLKSLQKSFNYTSAQQAIKVITQATRTSRICQLLESYVEQGMQRCSLPGLQPWDYIFAHFSKTEMSSLGKPYHRNREVFYLPPHIDVVFVQRVIRSKSHSRSASHFLLSLKDSPPPLIIMYEKYVNCYCQSLHLSYHLDHIDPRDHGHPLHLNRYCICLFYL